jgi:hypothetical protein
MGAQGWPFAVARGRLTGFQAIVVPDFLADGGETYLLEYATGAEEDAAAGDLIVRALRESAAGPVTIAYRVTEVTADRYGLEGGRAPLRDRAGRDIRVFEGLALRLPARSVTTAGITAADLDGVTERIAPAFRRLWEAIGPIEPDRCAPVPLGSGRPASPVLETYLSDPGPRLQRHSALIAALAIIALVILGVSVAIQGSPAAPHHSQTARPRSSRAAGEPRDRAACPGTPLSRLGSADRCIPG